MLIRSASLGGQKVVVAVPLEEMRAFHKIQLCTMKYRLDWADKLSFGSAELLKPDTRKRSGATAVVLQHVHKPLLTVVIMEKRRVET